MRKTLAILISALMILPLLCVGTSAAAKPAIGSVAAGYTPDAAATAVADATAFAAMAADGNYYLTADIALTATYAVADVFTGTLDGCGHTITLSGNPVFTTMNGTVKNLTLAGSVTKAEAGNIGALAISSTAASVFTNILNKAAVSNTVDVSGGNLDGCVGGIVGRVGTAAPTFTDCQNDAAVSGPEATGGIVGESQILGTTFNNCVNNGAVTSVCTDSGTASGGIIGYNGNNAIYFNNCTNNGKITSAYRAGGIEGDARKSAQLKNCVNNGDIKAVNAAGGMVGYGCDGGTKITLLFENCINTGKVDAYTQDAGTGDAASMIGYVGAKNTTSEAITFTVNKCINTGDISGGYRVGGFIGYAYGMSGKAQYAVVTNSVNTGKLSFGRFGSEFIGYTNSPDTTIKNCIGAGELATLTAKDGEGVAYVPRICIFGCSSAAVEQCVIEDVVLIDGGKTEWYTWASYSEGEGLIPKDKTEIDLKNSLRRIPLTTILGKDLNGSKYTYTTYADAAFTVLKADNENTYTATADTPVNVKAVTRLAAPTEAAVKALNKAAGSNVVYFKDGAISLTPGSTPPPPTGDNAVYFAAIGALALVTVLSIVVVPSKKRAK